jgi:acyl carrier protein
MSEKEKLALLEDMFELEEGDLTVEMKLDDVDEWDSMSKLSLIVLMSDEFGKKLSGDEIDKFNTIGDILNAMC